MEWFTGSIEDSIATALNENKIFIVYVEGDNEESKRMIETWNDEEVAKFCAPNNCVAIKIRAGSSECNQFSQCYPVLYIPSTYLINQSGIPTDIIPGYLEAVKFISKLSTTFKIQPEKHTKYVSEHKKLEATGGSSLEQKEREKKEKKYSKENIARKKAKFRNEGNGDKMLKNEELQEDKTRKERRTTRIQLRFANGSTLTKEFSTESKLLDIINTIKQVEGFESSDINLATVYPRHKFHEYQMDSTLLDLNLVPNAALFVVQQEHANTVTSNNSILDFLKFVLRPFLALFIFLKMLMPSQKEDSAGDSSKAESDKSYREAKYKNKTIYEREGRIYTFKQDEEDDDEDKDKKTWNGNSTQQM